jgi:hypothetical protein
MPKIVLNPRLENNIKIVEFREYFNAPPDKQEELMRDYEDGYLLVLRGYRFDAGREVLSKITFPNEKRAKKIFLSTPENDHMDHAREAEWKMIKEEFLAGDTVRIQSFYDGVVAANTELFRLIDGLFPRYRYKKKLCIYNLSEMLGHNLHFDSPQHAGEWTQVRAFVNVDDFPRIWHLSERLEQVADRYYEKAGAAATIGAHPREFTRTITRAVYGDRYDSGSHTYPKHCLAFQPGEVWFLNPNMTAHEVVYGRRLLDGVFLFDQRDLRNRARYYPALVKNIHKQKIGAANYWARRFIKSISPS